MDFKEPKPEPRAVGHTQKEIGRPGLNNGQCVRIDRFQGEADVFFRPCVL